MVTTVPPEAPTPSESHLQRFLWSVGEARRRRRSATAATATTSIADAGCSRAPRPSLVEPRSRERFDLRSVRHSGHVYLEVVGEIGGANAREFSEAVRALVGAGERSLVVDLGQAAVADQSGVSALEGALKLLSLHKGELVLKSPRSGTLRCLELAGLGHSFTVC